MASTGASTRVIGAAIKLSHTLVGREIKKHRESCNGCKVCRPLDPPKNVTTLPTAAIEVDEDAVDAPIVIPETIPELEAELGRCRELAVLAYRSQNLKEYNTLARTITIMSKELKKLQRDEAKPVDDSEGMLRAAEGARAALRRMLDQALGRRAVEKDAPEL